jgi:Uma2 family endonuclease
MAPSVAERLRAFSFEEYAEVAADRTGHTILNPTVLVEVQSPSTESDDHGPKLDCCKAIASVHVILLVAQDRPHVVVHTKQADGSFLRTDHESGVIELTDIGCRLPIAEIYEDLPGA